MQVPVNASANTHVSANETASANGAASEGVFSKAAQSAKGSLLPSFASPSFASSTAPTFAEVLAERSAGNEAAEQNGGAPVAVSDAALQQGLAKAGGLPALVLGAANQAKNLAATLAIGLVPASSMMTAAAKMIAAADGVGKKEGKSGVSSAGASKTAEIKPQALTTDTAGQLPGVLDLPATVQPVSVPVLHPAPPQTIDQIDQKDQKLLSPLAAATSTGHASGAAHASFSADQSSIYSQSSANQKGQLKDGALALPQLPAVQGNSTVSKATQSPAQGSDPGSVSGLGSRPDPAFGLASVPAQSAPHAQQSSTSSSSIERQADASQTANAQDARTSIAANALPVAGAAELAASSQAAVKAKMQTGAGQTMKPGAIATAGASNQPQAHISTVAPAVAAVATEGGPGSGNGITSSGTNAVSATETKGQANPFQHMDSGDPQAMVLRANAHEVAVGVRDPALGWVEIRTQSSAGHLNASFTAGSTEAHAALAAQVPSMTQYLADRNVHVQSVSVGTQSGFDGGGQAQSQAQSQPGSSGTDFGGTDSGGTGQQPYTGPSNAPASGTGSLAQNSGEELSALEAVPSSRISVHA